MRKKLYNLGAPTMTNMPKGGEQKQKFGYKRGETLKNLNELIGISPNQIETHGGRIQRGGC